MPDPYTCKKPWFFNHGDLTSRSTGGSLMSVPEIVNLLFLVVLIVGVLILILPTRRPQDYRMSSGPIFRDDDQYWLGGIIYNNPNDPEWLVPKRYGLGWTVNVGHPGGRLIMGGLIALVLVVAILSILVPGFSSQGCHQLTGCH
jgi:uncharacterized membrane protein